MNTIPRRWDGRTWTARAAIAVLPVLATGIVGTGQLVLVAVITCGWIPMISLTQWVQDRRPGAVQRLLALAVDLTALWVLAEVEPALAPVALVLLAGAGFLHAAGLPPTGRAIALGLVILAQLVVGAPDTAIAIGVATLDVTAAVVGIAVLGERDRHRQRTSAALDRADQLTDAVLAGIGEAVVVTDPAGVITSTNDAAELTFGHPVAGRCSDALGLRRGAGMLDCSRGCPLLDEEAGTGRADVSRDHPDGTRQALLVNVRAIRSATGRVRAVVHSYRDISSLKRADLAKTLFLATASHELKTPVAVITGYLSLLEQDAVPPEQRAVALRTIRSRTDQLRQIIDRLLLTSSIEAGGVTLSTTPTELPQVVRERVDALQEVTDREITVRTPSTLPLVEADTMALATVLDHLVENAVKYSPDGGPVTVTLAASDTHVTVDVADEGVGMSAADAERCFEAFWQAEGDDTRRFSGSGVGLYIVRSMSRAMGGDTTVVRAVPGEGTTFRLTLRRADVEAPAPEMSTATGPETMIDEFMRQVGLGEDA